MPPTPRRPSLHSVAGSLCSPAPSFRSGIGRPDGLPRPHPSLSHRSLCSRLHRYGVRPYFFVRRASASPPHATQKNRRASLAEGGGRAPKFLQVAATGGCAPPLMYRAVGGPLSRDGRCASCSFAHGGSPRPSRSALGGGAGREPSARRPGVSARRRCACRSSIPWPLPRPTLGVAGRSQATLPHLRRGAPLVLRAGPALEGLRPGGATPMGARCWRPRPDSPSHGRPVRLAVLCWWSSSGNGSAH